MSQKWDMGGTDLSVNSVNIGATAPGVTGTALSSTELAVLDSVTAGTAAASKAVVLGASKNISTITSATITTLTAPTIAGAVALTGAPTVTGLLTANGGTVLGAGTASVAPLTLTSGTNLTAAAAGAVEFDGTAFYATAVASSRQQLDAEQFVIATANSATYNNTLLDTSTAAPVFTTTTSGTAAGALTVVAGKTYCFEFMYNLTNTGTTSHTWATLLAGSATFSAGSSYCVTGVSGTTASTPSTGGLQGFIASTTLSTPVVVTAASTSATEQVAISGFGTLVINGVGTIIPSLKASARPGASGTPGVIVLAGSFFRIWEMSSTAAVGNWS